MRVCMEPGCDKTFDNVYCINKLTNTVMKSNFCEKHRSSSRRYFTSEMDAELHMIKEML